MKRLLSITLIICISISYFSLFTFAEEIECEHDWVLAETVQATCIENGYIRYECSQCGEEKIDDIVYALGHNLVYEDRVEPTCFNVGHNDYVYCTRCDYTTKEEYPVINHVAGDPYMNDIILPTCTIAGSHSESIYCIYCGTELDYKDVIDPPLGHDYGLWEYEDATCYSYGYAKYICHYCDFEYTEVLEKVDHQYINGICKYCGKLDNSYKDKCNKFIDMPDENHWAYNALVYCIGNGLMAGTSSSMISPNVGMTRAMFVTVLYRLDGAQETTAKVPFKDLYANWYKIPVAWAYEHNITSGTSETTFSPDMILTREQAVTMLYNYYKYLGFEVSFDDTACEYIDYQTISIWARIPIKWAVSNGIISGVKEDRIVYIKPQAILTRAQAAIILMNFDLSSVKKDY